MAIDHLFILLFKNSDVNNVCQVDQEKYLKFENVGDNLCSS